MACISIIIPCYNVEEYIDRCMKTVVNQTIGIENLEIILVNDASTDGTLAKLEFWEKQYPENIMVVTYDENIRQGGARNVGIQYATSDYIGFIDSDDWAELDMYEVLYSKLQLGDFDVVRGKYERNTGLDDIHTYDVEPHDYIYEFKKIGNYYDYQVSNIGNIGVMGGVYTGLYKKSVIVDNDIWFPERIAYEDNYWGTILNLHIKNIYIVDRIIYHYFANLNSTVSSRNAVHQFDRLDIEIAIVDKYKELGLFEYFKERLEVDFIQRFYLNTMFIMFTRFDYIPDVFPFMKEKVYEYFPEFRKNPMIQNLNGRNEALLSLLEIPGELSIDALQQFKISYLASF